MEFWVILNQFFNHFGRLPAMEKRPTVKKPCK